MNQHVSIEEQNRRIKEGCKEVKRRLRRAILTVHVSNDPDRWVKAAKVHGVEYKPEQNDYSDEDAPPPLFQPTPEDIDRCLPDLEWLRYLATQPDGHRDIRIIYDRAYKVPAWKIGQRYGVDRRTVYRWLDGAYAAIYWRCLRDKRHQ